MSDVWVVDAVRTPIGRYAGGLSGIRPDDLAATVVRELVARHTAAGFDPAGIDDVLLGNANGAGEDNRNVARMAGLLAGLPTSVPGATVNRLCGSGMEAVIQGSRAIDRRRRRRRPRRWRRVDEPCPVGAAQAGQGLPRRPRDPALDHAGLADGQPGHAQASGPSPSARAPRCWPTSSRSAARSRTRSRSSRTSAPPKAWDNGVHDAQVVLVEGSDLTRDEGIRPEASMESLARLKPVFRKDGTVTAGNASPLNDGAAALFLADDEGVARLGGPAPLARVVSRAAAGVDPQVFGIGPVEAANRALARAGITWADLDVVELNEAFASQSLACLRSWPELDPSIVNVNGGAIAIGHPLGASGARVVGALAHELHRRGGGWGLATICIGVGQGLAVVLRA